ncbi:hypothetical protein D6D10_08744 [Aureobasidium pullulans]|uniref:Uncharacterized protein n=1 Tax=Aureobasidium pullulans TaxID=5580 RepID=A0A4S9E9G7_AURPU|nr:hypothetical protein D6D10_08744 [Aureobasidium pullulans]
MKRLNYLDIDNNISRAELFERIKRGNSTPFQHLTKLELCATSPVMSAAVYVLPNVTKLTLCLKDGTGACFKDLSAMPNLRKLILLGTKATTLTREELDSLRALHQLEKLRIAPSDSCMQDIHAAHFTDADFDLMVSGFPEMRNFAFDVICEPRSISVLSSLSRSCPKLEKLQLNGNYDLQALNNMPAKMFPLLRYLRMDDSSVSGITVRLSPLQIARLIDNHAPMLEELVFMADMEDSPVTVAWSKIR